MPNDKINIVYVTSSKFKSEENKVFLENCALEDGAKVSDIFHFEIASNTILESLEVDLRVMVQAEVTSAYSQLKVPCIVEHAGLIFKDYETDSYPGGLTKPMWNTLGDNFISETNSGGREAIARAVIAYCDGKSVYTYVGETEGKLSDKPIGSRKFYWDTIFIPNDPNNPNNNKTYAEIVEDKSLGLEYKIKYLSQSSKAMLEFLNDYRKKNMKGLWQ